MAFAGRPARWLHAALLGIIALAMVGALLLVIQTVEAERDQRRQMQSTSEILVQLRNVGGAAINAETGQRGYLITLDNRYLEPYRTGSVQIDPALDRLRDLMRSNASARQIELLDQIDMLARAKFAEMERSVATIEDGELLEARRSFLTDEGQETMQRLRRAIREMEQIELGVLRQAAERTAQAEARVLPLLGMLGVLLLLATIGVIGLVTRTARAEAEAAQAGALSEARDRADLLAHELNHRVKNLFAVILAIVQMSARDKPEAKEVTQSIAQRIRALLTAHEVTQGELERPVASLEALVETTLAPYRSERQPAEIGGPKIMLPAKRVTPLGLVLHELTTNAVKYGAWSKGGSIEVKWERVGENIELRWLEKGVVITEAPEHTGFGSMLMTSAARQFGGSIEREFGSGGLEVTIMMPVGE